MNPMSGPGLKAPDDLYITDELDRRPARGADHLAEKHALQDLAARMLDNPEEVLPRFVELAMQMTGGISAGLSLFEENPAPGIFRWRYLRGALAPFEDATTPRNFSPCGITLDQNRPVLSLHPERFYNWISDAHIVVPEVLLVPLYLGGREPLGTLWVVSETEGHFHSGHAATATDLARFVGIALKMLRTRQDLQTALEEQETLAREMGHRVKNLFAIAEGMVRITARGTETKDDMAAALVGRFHALASAHALVRRSFRPGEGKTAEITHLKALLLAILEPHEQVQRGGPAKVRVSCPDILCGSHAVNGLALIFHELATNAAKYGALAADTGLVTIDCAVQGQDVIVNWHETGGGRIAAPPQNIGFGSKLLNDTITRQFRGDIVHDWRADGLDVRIRLPLADLAD